MARLVFQLGTNNWQRDGEFAPGSGVLHELQHHSLNALPDTHAYSLYPSRTQRPNDSKVRVFDPEHDIPICESASPVSNLRWHQLSDAQVHSYRHHLAGAVDAWINEIELEHREYMHLAIAHHAFMNPIVMADVNERRIETGRPRIPVLCFVHGTALKMLEAEQSGRFPEEFPVRFSPMVEAERVFEAQGARAVDFCATTTTRQIATVAQVFPDFAIDRIVLAPHGYDQTAFKAAMHPAKVPAWRRGLLPTFITKPYFGSEVRPQPVPGDYDYYVVFNGKFAEWKRLDALLHAAAIWERNGRTRIATLVTGSGSLADQRHYQDLAYRSLGLRDTFFLGARSTEEVALLYTAADVAAFPSRNEPLGLTLIEALACGTPVIGANSGSPKDCINDDLGVLVLESEDTEVLAARLADAVARAVAQDWKQARGPYAMRFAEANFSARTQVDQLLAQLVREPVPA